MEPPDIEPLDIEPPDIEPLIEPLVLASGFFFLLFILELSVVIVPLDLELPDIEPLDIDPLELDWAKAGPATAAVNKAKTAAFVNLFIASLLLKSRLDAVLALTSCAPLTGYSRF